MKIFSVPRLCIATGVGLFVLNFYVNPAFGQFYGGKGDGANLKALNQAYLAEPIFLGSKGDGNVAVFLQAASMGEVVFTGGRGDGFHTKLYSNGNMGETIFAGGNGDGYSFKQGMVFSLGEIIYRGSIGDGYHAVKSSQSQMGEPVFNGNNGDGFASKLSSNTVMGEPVFSGNKGDGFASKMGYNQSMGESIFVGGRGDGQSMKLASQVPLPLTLISFTGKWDDMDAILNWHTAHENNVELYKIFREIEGENLQLMGEHPAAKQAIQNKYLLKDPNMKSVIGHRHVIYHLWEVSISSDSVEVGMAQLKGDKLQQMTIFPSPNFDYITVAADGLESGTFIRVLSLDGKTLQEIRLNGNGHQWQNRIDVRDFARSTYIISIMAANGEILFSRQIALL